MKEPTFDHELELITSGSRLGYMTDAEAIKSIKQAVDKYVIGEDLPKLTRLQVPNEIAIQVNYRLAEQRQSLWGAKQ